MEEREKEVKNLINRILLWAVSTQGIYLLLVILIIVFYKPILIFMGAGAEHIEAGRPVPYVTLGGGFVILLLTAFLSYWIYRIVDKGKNNKVPCILVFTMAGLTSIFSLVGSNWEPWLIGQLQSPLKLESFSLLSNALLFAAPFKYASMVLFVIGAALTICRKTTGSSKPIFLPLCFAAVGQGVYFLGIAVLTLFQKEMRPLWHFTRDLIDVPMQIPYYLLTSSAFAFGITILFTYMIITSVRNEKSPKLPCIYALVFSFLAPVIHILGRVAELSIVNTGGLNEVLVFSILFRSISVLEPIFTINLYLFAAGSALALYRSTLFVSKNRIAM